MYISVVTLYIFSLIIFVTLISHAGKDKVLLQSTVEIPLHTVLIACKHAFPRYNISFHVYKDVFVINCIFNPRNEDIPVNENLYLNHKLRIIITLDNFQGNYLSWLCSHHVNIIPIFT